MSVHIAESVREETRKCSHDFSCLSNDKSSPHPACEVDNANGKNVLILTSKEVLFCPYQMPFGDELICTCPTHYAIY